MHARSSRSRWFPVVATLVLALVAVSGPTQAVSKHQVLDVPNKVLADLRDVVSLKASYPDHAFIGDHFTINAHVQNEIEVPILFSVEVVPMTDACSVVSYAASSGGLEVRQHEYLVWGNDTHEHVATTRPQNVINDDTVHVSTVLEAAATGTCRVRLQAVVKAPLVGMVAVGKQDLPGISVWPLPKRSHLGSMVIAPASGCGSHGSILHVPPVPPDVTSPVQAGKVNVKAALVWSDECSGAGTSAMLAVAHRDGGAWIRVAGGVIGGVGTETADADLELEQGSHQFLVSAVLVKSGWNRWQCWLALAGTAGGLVAIAVLLVGPAPVPKLQLAGAFLLLLGSLTQLPACKTRVIASAEQVVTVEAKNGLEGVAGSALRARDLLGARERDVGGTNPKA